MRPVFVLSAALILSLAASGARAAAIGGPLVRDGLEIIPGTQTDAAWDRNPVPVTPSSVFLVADIHAARDEAHGFAEHAFIPYLSVSYALTKDDTPTYKKSGLLYPVAAKGGPHYAAAAEMAGPGTYHLTYIVSPPVSHGMMRRTDKAGGVPDWWKPITASWTFDYPGTYPSKNP
ncbi:MAG TPA: iron transporter [Rhizomicrobium sp.]